MKFDLPSYENSMTVRPSSSSKKSVAWLASPERAIGSGSGSGSRGCRSDPSASSTAASSEPPCSAPPPLFELGRSARHPTNRTSRPRNPAQPISTLPSTERWPGASGAGAKLGAPPARCVGGGGTSTFASGVETAAVSTVDFPHLAQKTSSGPSSLPQFVQYLWATAALPP